MKNLEIDYCFDVIYDIIFSKPVQGSFLFNIFNNKGGDIFKRVKAAESF